MYGGQMSAMVIFGGQVYGSGANAQHTLRTPYGRKKEPLFFHEYILIRDVIRQNFVLLLSMNIIIDDTYLISGIYTNFRRLGSVVTYARYGEIFSNGFTANLLEKAKECRKSVKT